MHRACRPWLGECVNRVLVFFTCVLLSGCVQRWVDPPSPREEGAFLVHVVKAPDESLPKILTWYSGTTLSQQIVIKYNPFLLQREIRVGDKIIIPIEIVANKNAFGTAPENQVTKVPNLLMGESAPPAPAGAKKPAQERPKPAQPLTDLPGMRLETFNDDTNPDAAGVEGEGKVPVPDERVKQLQQEIADKQRELESLQAPRAGQPGDEDMPPPGLLREYEGS